MYVPECFDCFKPTWVQNITVIARLRRLVTKLWVFPCFETFLSVSTYDFAVFSTVTLLQLPFFFLILCRLENKSLWRQI